MSGIAKPGVKFSGSKTPTQVIPVDFIKSVEKIDIPAFPTEPAATAEWGILITYTDVLANPPSKVMFTTEAARDTSFTSFETLICATVA